MTKIEWVQPSLPAEWHNPGYCLPIFRNVDDLTQRDLLELDQDIFQARSGDITIDVGWYPDFDRSGQFWGQVVRGTDWDDQRAVEQECHSRDPLVILAWVENVHKMVRTSLDD